MNINELVEEMAVMKTEISKNEEEKQILNNFFILLAKLKSVNNIENKLQRIETRDKIVNDLEIEAGKLAKLCGYDFFGFPKINEDKIESKKKL